MELPDESSDREREPDGADPSCGDNGQDDVGWLSQPSSELYDHRRRGEFETRYPTSAWWQIGFEFVYLVLILAVAAALLLWIGFIVAAPSPADHRVFGSIEYPRDRSYLLWIAVGLSGVIGGASFALKWLYHSVAKWGWNRDRILWRLIVPFLSGVLAVFVAMMIASGIVSIFNSEFFNTFYGALGGGFFVGYFSDNVLASLQNLAVKWFGTVDKRYHRLFPKGEAPPEVDHSAG